MRLIRQAVLIILMFGPFSLGVNSVSLGQVGSVKDTLTNKVTAVRSNCTYIIQTAKSIYEADERIVLVVTVRNTGATEFNYSGDPGPVYRSLRVLLNDKACPLTMHGQQVIDNPFCYGHGLGLRAGTEWRNVYHLNRAFDMTMGGDYKVYLKEDGQEADPIIIRIQDNGLKFE